MGGRWQSYSSLHPADGKPWAGDQAVLVSELYIQLYREVSVSLNPACRPPWGQQQGDAQWVRALPPRPCPTFTPLSWPRWFTLCLFPHVSLSRGGVSPSVPRPWNRLQQNGKRAKAVAVKGVVAQPWCSRSVWQRPWLQPAITVTSFWFPRLI